MAVFECDNGHSVYIDNRLKEQLDTKIIPIIQKKDQDRVLLVDGRERSGKSVFTFGNSSYLAKCLGTRFDLSNVCMTPDEFRQRIMHAKKNEVIIYDEAHRGMASARALSEVNNILKDLMMEMGQRNLIVFVVLPCFFLLDKYVALFRSTGLFHVYINKNKHSWVYFNEKNKQKLYLRGKKELNYNCIKWPHFRGRFSDQYGTIDEAEYRKKKAKSFQEAPRETKVERNTVERDKLMKYLHEELKYSSRKISNILNNSITDSGVRQAIEKITEKIGITEENMD